jgi:hypothetical protein
MDDLDTPPTTPGGTILAATLGGLLAMSSACADPEPPAGEERFGEPSRTEVQAPIPYRNVSNYDFNYSPSGASESVRVPIGDLIDDLEADFESTRKANNQGRTPVWYGFSSVDGYPLGGRPTFGEVCDPQFGNEIYALESLRRTPKGQNAKDYVTIEGIVTLHPRHYEKLSTCGEGHRYYGAYVLQDESGSIMVLKDSLIADFSYGDRVRIKVRGVVKQFGQMAVIAHETERIERRGSPQQAQGRGPVPYKRLQDTSFADAFDRGRCPRGRNVDLFGFKNRYLDVPDGLGDTYRIEGTVCREPTSRNFNEFTVTSGSCSDQSSTRWTVSMGLDLGRLGLDIERGDRVRVTGPVFGRLAFSPSCGWRFTIQATTVGQLEIDPRNP